MQRDPQSILVDEERRRRMGLERDDSTACRRAIRVSLADPFRDREAELNEVAALEGLKMDWANRVRLEAVRNNLLRLWSRS